MGFYNHYTVIGAKMKCTFVNNFNSIAPDGNSYVGIMQTASPNPLILDINTVQENKQSHIKVQTIQGTRPRTVTSSVNLSKALGQKVLQEDNNAGDVSSNPVEQWYWHIMAASVDAGTTNPRALRVRVEIEYIAILHEPKEISGS